MIFLEHLPVGQHRLPCSECSKGRKDDALGVTITGPGEGVFHCFRCDWAGRIGKTTRQANQRIKRKPDRNKLDGIKALIARSKPIRGTIAEQYLISRSIELPPPGRLFDDNNLRYVPDCWHWPSELKLPCMIGIITNVVTNDIQAIHQTFLSHDGTKADVDKPRLYLGPKAGGVVRLTADEDVAYGLAIAEGIETAFAGPAANYPTWACLDAGNLAAFPVLDGIEALTILADNDQAGIKAAKQCAGRWAGREVRIALTQGDWNDRLQGIANA